MATHGKKYREVAVKVSPDKEYTVEEAAGLLKEISYAKFDASIELHVHLGVDPRNADQQVRGTVVLPHGTGKTKRVAVFTADERAEDARKAGADIVGGADLAEKIKGGFLDFDACIATPDMMKEVGKLGKVLGPRNLMPSPKAGTVTNDVAAAIKEIKSGRVEYRLDRNAVIHMVIGKISFSAQQIADNLNMVLEAIAKAKPASAKGHYMKNVSVASTMSPGLRIAYVV
ncbi:MAG: 50S ribosomal protein L1 [Candidatus Sumerlaeota bacterium]|nr:50S ribosomal protein L1 [Candidatus Sumerlaeota bacterium]